MKKTSKKEFYNSNKINSYNCIFNFIIGARNLGKTTAFKMRAFKRFKNKGRKTVWVRRFKAESKRTRKGFYNDKILELLNEKAENFKNIGNDICYKVGDKFVPFITIVSLAEFSSVRSSEDAKTDTIIFDEFTTTPAKYKLYHGDEASDFIDLVSTTKRAHPIKVFFLGNKESVLNPYFSYFKLPEIEPNFNGIRTYKNHSIAVEIRDDVPDEVAKSYEGKWEDALKDTAYYDYLTIGTYKKRSAYNRKTPPKSAEILFQFDFARPLSVYRFNGCLYVKNGVDKTRLVWVDIPKEYNKQYILTRQEKFRFERIVKGLRKNLIYYENDLANESFYYIIKAIV